MTEHALNKETTSHPYVVINKDVCDGSPIIEGTRTRVLDIAIEYEVLVVLQMKLSDLIPT